MLVTQGGGSVSVNLPPPYQPKLPPTPPPPSPPPTPPGTSTQTSTYTNRTTDTGSASASTQGYTTSGPPQPGQAGYLNLVAAQTGGGGGGGGGGTGGQTGTTNLPAALTGSEFVSYVRTGCGRLGLDTLAVFANALNEGLSGGIGDNGIAYGPWQTHFTDGRVSEYDGLPPYSEKVQYYAWSKAGIDFVLNAMADDGAAGKTGHSAVATIVADYERPADIPGDTATRDDTYDYLVSLGDSVWSYLAVQSVGPSLTPIATATAVAITQPVATDGPSGNWKNWIQFIGGDWAGAGTYVSNVAMSLHSEVFG